MKRYIWSPAGLTSRPIVLLIAALLCAGMIQAQQSVPATGGDATGSGGSASYTVGQIDYITAASSSGSAAQGVQHAYEFLITDIENTASETVDLTAYPNPTSDMIILDFDGFQNGSYSYTLTDAPGKTLQFQQILSSQTQVNMEELPVAVYFLNISNGNTLVKQIKILKK